MKLNAGERLKSLLFYTGFIPLFPSLLFRRTKNDGLANEYANALAVSFVQTLTLIAALLIWIFGFYAVAQFSPRSLETLRIGNLFILVYPALFLLLVGIIIWLIYTVAAVSGFKIKIPLVTKLSKNRRILILSYFINISLVLILCLILAGIFHSNKLAQHPQKPAKVYMLYDDMGFVPHWVFPFGFYQIQREAIKKWGHDQVSIVPISNESVQEAIQNATMIFFSVHGDWSFGEFAGTFHFANEARDEFYGYGPDQIEKMGVGENLKFVYLAQCNGGVLADEWPQAFAPAMIKSFDRISLYPEHIFWLWYKLPRILRNDIKSS